MLMVSLQIHISKRIKYYIGYCAYVLSTFYQCTQYVLSANTGTGERRTESTARYHTPDLWICRFKNQEAQGV